MAQFQLKIAGAVAAVTSLFDSTPHYFKAYLTEDTPDFFVTVTEQDLRFEQAELDREAMEEGFRRREFTDPFLERAAIQRAFAEYLFAFDTLLLHGSTVSVDGKAYLFVAKSGTGKSTHTRLWREAFGTRAVMINDDKPFLRLTDTAVVAFGSPWSGKHGLDTNLSVPLAGICILERGTENVIRPMPPELALPRLRKEAYAPMEEEKYPQFQTLVEKLSRQVPLWHMTCTKDHQAAQVAYDAMGKKQIRGRE
jgi:hypothetical protein